MFDPTKALGDWLPSYKDCHPDSVIFVAPLSEYDNSKRMNETLSLWEQEPLIIRLLASPASQLTCFSPMA